MHFSAVTLCKRFINTAKACWREKPEYCINLQQQLPGAEQLIALLITINLNFSKFIFLLCFLSAQNPPMVKLSRIPSVGRMMWLMHPIHTVGSPWRRHVPFLAAAVISKWLFVKKLLLWRSLAAIQISLPLIPPSSPPYKSHSEVPLSILSSLHQLGQ